MSGYTDTTPFGYYAGIPSIDFNFGGICGENIELGANKSIIGICAQAALSLALTFSGKLKVQSQSDK